MTDPSPAEPPPAQAERRYAHELYPHPAAGEVRPLAVEVPYLYARAIGFEELGTLERIDTRGRALIADALLQGLTGDEAWQWAESRDTADGAEVVRDRARHYGVDPDRIRPYHYEGAPR